MNCITQLSRFSPLSLMYTLYINYIRHICVCKLHAYMYIYYIYVLCIGKADERARKAETGKSDESMDCCRNIISPRVCHSHRRVSTVRLLLRWCTYNGVHETGAAGYGAREFRDASRIGKTASARCGNARKAIERCKSSDLHESRGRAKMPDQLFHDRCDTRLAFLLSMSRFVMIDLRLDRSMDEILHHNRGLYLSDRML